MPYKFIESLRIDRMNNSFRKGALLFEAGDQNQSIIYLKSGSAELVKIRLDGYRQVIERYEEGDFIAPHTLYSDIHSFRCEACTNVDTVQYTRTAFKDALKREANTFYWLELLHNHLHRSLMRVELLGYTSVSDKLDAWIKLYKRTPEKGEYSTVAGQLSISREALYRELSKRRVG